MKIIFKRIVTINIRNTCFGDRSYLMPCYLADKVLPPHGYDGYIPLYCNDIDFSIENLIKIRNFYFSLHAEYVYGVAFKFAKK